MADLFKLLAGALLFTFVVSRWIFQGYLSTYKKLQLKWGGQVRNGWVNFPQFILAQDEDEIIVSAYPSSGTRQGAAYATGYSHRFPNYRFSVVSRKMPNASFWKIPENWTPAEDPGFASKFKFYSERPEFLGFILTKEIRALLIALEEIRLVGVRMDTGDLYKDGRSDAAKQVPFVSVTACPNTADLDIAEQILKLCVAFRNRILELGAQLPEISSGPASALPVRQLFK